MSSKVSGWSAGTVARWRDRAIAAPANAPCMAPLKRARSRRIVRKLGRFDRAVEDFGLRAAAAGIENGRRPVGGQA